ncbi:MAG: YggS family pyridoxal phosphate-dependent enzyme [Desulfovibrionaceae bacterium]|nr:YggS family pyridoxal phosphate-dependent enzyme [Desulfovibrionaceae bacterium]
MVKESYERVLEQVALACEKCGRAKSSVKLLAVSKFHPFQEMLALYQLGQDAFGESYVQEALGKMADFEKEGFSPNFHFIGHLQTRKAPLVAGNFQLIHSLDSEKLGLALEKALLAQNKTQDVLLQVNLALEPQKSGVAQDQLLPLATFVLEHCPHLKLKGLMCLPPLEAEGEKARPYFVALRELRDKLALSLQLSLPELSMGMSGDFPFAIYEGATIVRVGTALFGPRPPK